MLGVRPIEMIVQTFLSEQAPTVNLHNHFCMAELLLKLSVDKPECPMYNCLSVDRSLLCS